MTKSLDGLISFLLDEIALCGPFGLDPCKFEDYVNRYYVPSGDESGDSKASDENGALPRKPYNVDRKLHEQAWLWLAQQPEVWVGKNGDGNELSLPQVQAVNKEYQNQKHVTKGATSTAPEASTNTLDDTSNTEQSATQTAPITSTEEPSPNIGASEEKSSKSASASPIRYRVYTSEARMWQALAGHAPDKRRIPPKYFECLSIITSRKTQGILQSELTKVSGQDKKSVPKRTDVLAEDGYIEKRAVVNKGAKTSMLFAKRFAPKSGSIPQNTSRGPSNANGDRKGDERILDYQPVFQNVIRFLKESNIMALVDLRRKLISIQIPLSKGVWKYCVKQLELVGLTQQIRARAHLENGKQGRYFQCLKLLREPAEGDWPLLFTGGSRTGEKDNVGPRASEGPSEDDQDAAEEDAGAPQGISGEPNLDNPKEDSRLVPQWVPERHLHNMISDVVDAAGTEGVSLKTLRHLTFGGGVVKPIERLMPRFVDSWQISQPLHLRHLAIIRDTKQSKRTGYYVHYTYDNFKRLVDRGATSWEAVAAVEKGRKKNISIPPPGAQADLDEYGFPEISSSQFLGADNEATLEACIRAAPVHSLDQKHLDVVDLHQDNDADHGGPSDQHKKKQSRKSDVSGVLRNQKRVEKVALPPNFNIMTKEAKRKLRNSQHTGIRYACAKFRKEVAEMIENGEDPDSARNSVFARIDFQHESRGLKPISEAMKAQLDTKYDIWRNRLEEEAMSNAQPGQDPITTATSPEPYQPSRHAHTLPLFRTLATIEGGTPDRKSNSSTAVRYYQPIVANTAPISIDSTPAQVDPRVPKKRGRPLKSAQSFPNAPKPPLYRPSVLAHTKRYLDPATFLNRRKRKSQLPKHLEDSVVLSDKTATLPSAPITAKRKRDSTDKPPSIKKARRITTDAFYKELTDSVQRPSTAGIRVSAVARDASRRGKPNSMIAVFKSDQLKDFSKFSPGPLAKTQPPPVTEEQRPDQVMVQQERYIHANPTLDPALTSGEPQDRRLGPEARLMAAQPDEVFFRNFLRANTVGPGGDNRAHAPRPDSAISGAYSQDSNTKATNNAHTGRLQVSRGNQDENIIVAQSSTATPEVINADGADEITRNTQHSAQASEPVDLEPRDPSLPGACTSTSGLLPGPGPEEPASVSGDADRSYQEPSSNAAEARDDQSLPRSNRNLFKAGDQDQASRVAALPPRSSTPQDSLQKQESLTYKKSAQLNKSGQEDSTRTEGQSPAVLPQLIEVEAESDPPKRTPTKPHKLNPPSGTMALRRKKIILDLLEKCGGVLPLDRSIESPFQEQWHSRGGEGRPDIVTIKAAIKQLVSLHQVRQCGFYFESIKGKGLQKSIIMIKTLDIYHPKVRECQKQIIKCDPYAYTPPELRRPGSSRQAFIDSIQAQKSKAEDINQTVQLQPKRLYQIRLEVRKKAAEEKKQRKIEKANEEKRLREGKEEEQRRLRQQKEDEEEAERQRQRREERQRIHAKLTDLRAQTVGRLLTTEEQHEWIAHHSAVMALDEQLAGLPPPPSLVATPAYKEFRPLTVPEPGLGQRRNTRFPHLAGSAPRKVERLAGLNDPVQRTSLGDEARPSNVGIFSVFALPQTVRRPIYQEIEQAETTDDEDSSDSDAEQFQDPEGLRKPLWRALKLDTINPDGSINAQGLRSLMNANEDDDTDQFRKDVDDLLRWELRYPDHEYDVQDTPFVNHTFLHKHKAASDAKTDMKEALQVRPTGKRGRHIVRPFPQVDDDGASTTPSISTRSVSLEPASAAQPTLRPLEELGLFNAPVDDPPAWIRFGPSSALKRKHDNLDNTRKSAPGGKAKAKGKRRRIDQLSAPDRHLIQQGEPKDGQPPTKRLKVRRPRKLKEFSVINERRLLVAVIAVRSIAGGLERNINWRLVTKVFEPDHDEMFIHNIWPTVRSKHTLLHQTITADFQERFPKAYEEGLVPSINFEHLDDYPWRKLVEWGMDMTDFPARSSAAIELPAQRSSLDNLFSLKPTTDINITPFFNPDQVNTNLKRQGILNKQAYTCPLTSSSQPSAPEENSTGLAIAKTWVRATVVTPAATYDEEAIRNKLLTFRVPIIERAIKELQASKVLTGPPKGPRQAGRNYDLHEACISSLDRSPSLATLRAASVFKDWLDTQFRTTGSVDIKAITKAEQALVLMNLFAAGRIRLRPKNPPRNKFGLLNGSYQTRLIDKELLKFSITISPTPSYEYCNPLLPTPPPPAPHLRPEMQQPAKIPLWYDLNGDLVTVLWEMCLAAVLSVVSVRPGVGVVEIEKAVKPALGSWEIEEILKWGVDIGAVEKVGKGWTVGELWWGVLGGKKPEEETGPGEAQVQERMPLADAPMADALGRETEEVAGGIGNDAEANRPRTEEIAKAVAATVVQAARNDAKELDYLPTANEHESTTHEDGDIEMTGA